MWGSIYGNWLLPPASGASLGANGWVNGVTGGAIYPYTKNAQIYICPSDSGGQARGVSYSMNSQLSWLAIAAINSPASVPCMVDESTTIDDGYFVGGGNIPSSIHNGGANILFCDAHAKWLMEPT